MDCLTDRCYGRRIIAHSNRQRELLRDQSNVCDTTSLLCRLEQDLGAGAINALELVKCPPLPNLLGTEYLNNIAFRCVVGGCTKPLAAPGKEISCS